jgi:hypothetical protein
MNTELPVLSPKEIADKKTELRKNYHIEIESDDEFTIEDVFEDEFFSSRNRAFNPGAYTWTPLRERLIEGAWTTGIMVGSVYLGIFFLNFVLSAFVQTPDGVSRLENVLIASLAWIYVISQVLIFPIVIISIIILLFSWRRELPGYKRNKKWSELYYIQRRELDQYVRQRLDQHKRG